MIDFEATNVEGGANRFSKEDRVHRQRIARRYFETLFTSYFVRAPIVAENDPRTFEHYVITVIRPDEMLVHPLIVAANRYWSSPILRLSDAGKSCRRDRPFEEGQIALPIWHYMALEAVDQIVSLVRLALSQGGNSGDRGYES